MLQKPHYTNTQGKRKSGFKFYSSLALIWIYEEFHKSSPFLWLTLILYNDAKKGWECAL